jgi:prevent-host-death family protein
MDKQKISKSQFKSRALELMRQVEQTGQPLIITDHGSPKLEIRVYRDAAPDSLAQLRGIVLYYHDPTEPVADKDWEQQD